MPMLRTIERPTKATLRPYSWAASSTCWMRCTWLAKQATMIRRSALAKTCRSTGEMSRSGGTKPGTSALVESTSSRSMPSSPSRAKAGRSVSRPSSGSWSILKSPVCRTMPAGVRMATASASGIEWLTAMNSQSKGPIRSRRPSSTSSVYGRIRCSWSLASISARVSWEPISGMSGFSRSRYGTPPMWSSWPWVRTMASMSSRRSRMEVKSGRIRSTPGCSSSGKSTPQSTISSRPAVLEDGHVAADLAEAAERDDAQTAFGKRRRGRELGMRMAQKVLLTARAAGVRVQAMANTPVRRGSTAP